MALIMQRLSLIVGITTLVAACSSDSGSNDDSSNTGGNTSIGTGGVASGTGGSAVGSGGTPVVGSGGSVASGTGGSTVIASGGTTTVSSSGGTTSVVGSGGTAGSGGVTQANGGTAGAAGMSAGGTAGATNGGASGADNGGSAGSIHHEDNPSAMSAAAKGPYMTTSYTMGLPDSPDYGTATIVYPTDATPPLSIIAAVPGFASPGSMMKAWSDSLATHGFAVIWVDTNSTSNQPPARSKAQLGALTTLKAENTPTRKPAHGQAGHDANRRDGAFHGRRRHA